MKLNHKGFTLVEMLAVVVILGVIMSIMIPNVQSILNKNKEDNYKVFKNNIILAAKNYFSDYRYEIVVSSAPCDSNKQKKVEKIQNYSLDNSKLRISYLFITGYLKGTLKNPKTSLAVNPNNSYVTVKYSCTKKDYVFNISDSDLN